MATKKEPETRIVYVLVDGAEVVPQLFDTRAEARTENEISDGVYKIRRAKLTIFGS